jgi:3-isopropylmalate/(R)-2-methylmalate dehydratase large subunit
MKNEVVGVRQTIVEKIFSKHCGKMVYAGECVIPSVDYLIGTDTKSPLAIEIFKKENLTLNFPLEKVFFVFDHYSPCTHSTMANQHLTIREFCDKYGIKYFETGEGIGYQLIPENNIISPGNLVCVSDSHAPTFGGMNVLGLAIGSSEFAAVLATGKMWFMVPETILVRLKGNLPAYVSSKDIALYLASQLGAEGADFSAIEFAGPGLSELSLPARYTLCNMAADIGAIAALMPGDEVLKEYFAEDHFVNADPDAKYKEVVEIDVGKIEPLVAVPHNIDLVKKARELKDVKVHQVFLGACTNGRLEDLRIAAKILKGKKIAKGLRFYIGPASRNVFLQAVKEGVMETLTEAGATILAPGCSLCVGLSGLGIPGDGEVVVSTANRNFQGRLGNSNSFIYITSPAVAATSAMLGYIADPREIMGVV